MIDILIMIFTGGGAIAILLAAIGVVRMPDLYLRLSVTTKAATLGSGLILLSAAFRFDDVGVTARVLAIIFFITITAPINAQLIARAAYLIKTAMWKHTVIDELEGMYDAENDTLHGIDTSDEGDAKVIKE